MPSTIARNLNLCFSKFIGSLETDDSPPISPTSTHHHHHNRPFPPATTSSSIFIKNFNSLYDHTIDYSTSSSFSTASISFQPEHESKPPADFATAFASQRFFFSSPGRSNSIVESAECTRSLSSSSSIATSTPAEPDRDKKLFNDSVAVPTYSPDPYLDFRRSMQEMVEARPELKDVRSNWDRLHELLLCYLALNPKGTHKFIVGAFADLLVSLMSQSNVDDVTAAVAGGGGHGGGGGC